jgi:hypothetical protein
MMAVSAFGGGDDWGTIIGRSGYSQVGQNMPQQTSSR